ncbi:MAG TPA: L,D-transpeptidase [Hyphomicrobium sp.]|nr:L,D-transpeptidase [Hyphomicrobium sp.]
MVLSMAKVGGFIAAVVAVTALAGSPGVAHAQAGGSGGLADLLWGGEPEFGGGRQTVTFNPEYKAGQIIVSFGDRRLYLITKPGQALSYPIAIPREQSRWEGRTTVSSKRENPDWRPTPTMLQENPRLPSWVPGGHPMNPLGVRALYLGSSLYRIHGTDAPWTIGQAVSKGCIRMFNEDVLDLYPRVPTGTTVTVTWERFKTDGVQTAAAPNETRARPRARAYQRPAARSARRSESTRDRPGPRKTGFFIVPEDEANPVRPEEGMVTRYGRNAGGGAVSRASQTVETSELDPVR